MRVSLWHDPLIGEKIFLGQVNLSIGSLKSFLNHDGWHWLCPRPTAPTQANRPDIGSLRIKVYYSQDVIYPLKVYDMLSHLLVESTVCPVSMESIAINQCVLVSLLFSIGSIKYCTLYVE